MNSSPKLSHRLKRWIYRHDRPNWIATALNRLFAHEYAKGGLLARDRDVTLEIVGRSTGKPIQIPVVLADVGNNWYVVSMLGHRANWVRNLRAANGRAAIHHHGTWPVHLDEVPVANRAPILRRYLAVAPGARPHCPVDAHEDLSSFVNIADQYPIFRVCGYPPNSPIPAKPASRGPCPTSSGSGG